MMNLKKLFNILYKNCNFFYNFRKYSSCLINKKEYEQIVKKIKYRHIEAETKSERKLQLKNKGKFFLYKLDIIFKQKKKLMDLLNISDKDLKYPLLKKLNDQKKKIVDQIVDIEQRIGSLNKNDA